MDLAELTIGDVWLVVLGVALLAFGLMVAICGVGGFNDILSLFRTLREDDDETASEQ